MEGPSKPAPSLPTFRPRAERKVETCPICNRSFPVAEIVHHSSACANRKFGASRPAHAGPKVSKKNKRGVHAMHGSNRYNAHEVYVEDPDYNSHVNGAGPSGLKAEGSGRPRVSHKKMALGAGVGKHTHVPSMPHVYTHRSDPDADYTEVCEGITVKSKKLDPSMPLYAVVQALRAPPALSASAGARGAINETPGSVSVTPLDAGAGRTGTGSRAAMPGHSARAPGGKAVDALAVQATLLEAAATPAGRAKAIVPAWSRAAPVAIGHPLSAAHALPLPARADGNRCGAAGSGALATSEPLPHQLAAPRQPPDIRPHGMHDYVWDDERLHFPTAESTHKLDQAEEYLTHVKALYGDKSETYEEFQRILNEFLNGASDTVLVMQRVAALFSARKDLVFAFNTFLPQGYRLMGLKTQHLPYLTCDGSAESTRALAENFVERLCEHLAPYPHLLVPMLEAIDRFPSADELRVLQSMEELMAMGAGGVPVSGMTLEQAESIRSAAAEVESGLNKLEMQSLVRELMQYLPTGLHNGLADSVQGYTHYIEVPPKP